MGILDRGRLVAVDTIDGLRDATDTTGEFIITLDSASGSLVETIADLDGVVSVTREGATIRVSCTNDTKGAIVRTCQKAGSTVENIETSEASLGDLFAAYTGGD